MAEAAKPPKVKLVCGIITARRELFDEAIAALAERFGSADIVSEIMDFDFTHYYDRQMGSPLYRRFAAFEPLIEPDALVEAKVATNQIERDFATRTAQGRDALATPRPINLDPGYIESSKLVLGSMKNFAHRLYLGRGVYGEVTLMYHKGRWDALPWTFPDYASGRYAPFLMAARDRLRQQTAEGER